MKRALIFLLAALMFSLAGCANNVVTSTESPATSPTTPHIAVQTEPPTEIPTQSIEETIAPTEEITTPTENDAASPMVMTLNPVQEDETAEDGTVVYSFRYQDISLLLPQNATVQAKIQDSMDALISYTKEQTKASAVWAKESYGEAGDWSAFYTDLFYTPCRMDNAVISVYAKTMDFNGGSHPNCTVLSMNFHGKTGEELRISDIISHESQLEELHSMVLEYLEGENGPKQLLDGYEEVVSERFNTAGGTSANWYLTEDGLVYYFAPYEVAAYRYGVVEVLLPYEMLNGILDDKYMPESSMERSCSIYADISANVNTDFERTHTIVLESEGESITLYGLENAGAVNISIGYFGIDDNQFYPTETLFSGKELTEQDCIQIITYIPDTIPNIRIQIGGEQGKTLYLSQSGMDGSILLLEEGSF